jgi:hypothetical protein
MIRTGGGAFDPADRPLYFVAGDPPEAHRRYHLTAVNDAMIESDTRHAIIEPIERGARLLLDSGIFNLTNRHMHRTGCTMDEALNLPPEDIDGFDTLYRRYIDLVHQFEPQLWGYIELDQGGRDNKRRTRQRLHAEGLNPIPVYHPLNDGWDYFDELAETHDRICFGNVVQAHPGLRVRLLHTMWERRRRYPHLWVHVLGLTANELSASIPSDSCDSSTFSSALRWGNTSTESAYLWRRLGELPRGFRYNRNIPRHDDGGWMQAAHVYCSQFDQLTDLWQNITLDRTCLGFEPWPAPVPGEQEPQPCQTTPPSG